MSNPLPSPTYLTLGQAAKLAKVAKSTITRAIEKGQLSAAHKVGQSYRIDPAELQRWQANRVNRDAIATANAQPANTPAQSKATGTDALAVHVRNAELEAELKALKASHDQMTALTEKMMADKDREIERLYTLALSDQRSKRGLWRRLFARNLDKVDHMVDR